MSEETTASERDWRSAAACRSANPELFFLDCAGLNVLVATRRRAQLEGGWVRLVRVPPQARRMISLLKLDWAFGLGTLGPVA